MVSKLSDMVQREVVKRELIEMMFSMKNDFGFYKIRVAESIKKIVSKINNVSNNSKLSLRVSTCCSSSKLLNPMSFVADSRTTRTFVTSKTLVSNINYATPKYKLNYQMEETQFHQSLHN